MLQGGDISTEMFLDIIHKEMGEIHMLDSLQSGKEDLAGVWEARTIGSGLRRHSDNQIRPFKPDDRPEMTKEYVGWEAEEEDALTENKGDWGSRKGRDDQEVSGSWERG